VRIVNYHPRALVGDGGVTNSVRRLSEALARAGAEAVIAYDGVGGPHREGGVEWAPMPHAGRGRLRLPIRIAPTLADADVLVLNSGWTGSNVRVGAAARRVDLPYVLAPRGAYDPLIVDRRRLTKRLWWALFERRLVASAAAVHVFFLPQQGHLERLGHTGPVLVAPNGVSIPRSLRWDGGSGGYVLFLGRFDPEHKGLDLLLGALARLAAADRPLVRLHGPDWRGGKAQVVDLVDRLGLQDHVHVGPALYGEEKQAALAAAAAFVYPSRWEGFGNSLAEAAAVGVPALATPYPLAQHLAELGACTVVEAEVDALAAGLRDLRASAATHRPVESVAAEFDWDAVASRWLTQLEELLEDTMQRPDATERGR
jgi:glycosyltransferase involved in cell wall biosynthesis